jgi:hypothetical protein
LIGIINWPYVKLTGKSLFNSPFAKGRGREGLSKKASSMDVKPEFLKMQNLVQVSLVKMNYCDLLG